MLVVLKVGVKNETDASLLHHVMTQPNLDPLHVLRESIERLRQLNNFLLLVEGQLDVLSISILL